MKTALYKKFRFFLLATIQSLAIVVISASPALRAQDFTAEDLDRIYKGQNYRDPDSTLACGVPPTTQGFPPLNSNSNIYYLGDSLTVGMRDYGELEKKTVENGYVFKGATAVGGKPLSWGLEQVVANEDTIKDSTAIVVGLGTNNIADVVADGATEITEGGEQKIRGQIGEIVDAVKEINPDITIYWTSVYVTGSLTTIYGTFDLDLARPVINRAISSAAGFYGLNVIPWGTSSEAVNLVSDDGIHPSGKYPEMADYIVSNIVYGSATTAAQRSATACVCSEGGISYTGAEGTFSAEVYGVMKELPATWVPILAAAGQEFGVDPNILAALMGNETNWDTPESFASDPRRNSATATGPLQMLDNTFRDFADTPDQWSKNTQSHTSRVPKKINDGTQFKTIDGVVYHIADGNRDGKVDRATPEDAAFLAAIYIKDLGASFDTPIGDEGDFRVPPFGDETLTVRHIGAYYNQGSGFSAESEAELEELAKGNNDVGRYMNMMSGITTAGRLSGVFGDLSVTSTGSLGCSGLGGSGGSIVDKVLEYAWVEEAKRDEIINASKSASDLAGCSMRDNAVTCGTAKESYGALIGIDDARPEFAEAVKRIHGYTNDTGSSWAFSDCGVFVSSVIRETVDPNYALRSTTYAQQPYVDAHPELYERIPFTDTGLAKPGDIILKNGHTAIYVGPNSYSQYEVADASWGQRVPTLSHRPEVYLNSGANENEVDDSSYYLIRYIGN